MIQPEQEIASLFVTEAGNELNDAVSRIKHCLKQLDDEQIQWRPSPSMNSIANLILHLCGNLHQWITAGVGGAEDVRNRPQEFSQHIAVTRDDLLKQLDAAVDAATEALHRVNSTDLLKVRHVQQWDETGIGAIFDSISHFRGHTQEIVHMTRCQLGDRYEFGFIPTDA